MKINKYLISIRNNLGNVIDLYFDDWYKAQSFIDTVLENSDNYIEVMKLDEEVKENEDN